MVEMGKVAKKAPSYLDAYLERFREWLTDHSISEFAINPDGQVWIERAGDAHMVPVVGEVIDPKKAIDIAQAIVGDANAKVSKLRPLVSGKVDYQGRPLRVQVAIPPTVETGASLSIRLFSPKGIANYRAESVSYTHLTLPTKRIV